MYEGESISTQMTHLGTRYQSRIQSWMVSADGAFELVCGNNRDDALIASIRDDNDRTD